jgi:hypothetical protein
MVMHACKSSTWEAEAGESPVPGQPGQLRETLSPKQKVKDIKELKYGWLLP